MAPGSGRLYIGLILECVEQDVFAVTVESRPASVVGVQWLTFLFNWMLQGKDVPVEIDSLQDCGPNVK